MRDGYGYSGRVQQEPGDEFWAWCLAVYARPHVARAALRLQDRCGACVMVALCLCWRAARGVFDDAASVAALEARAALAERQLLVPLRAARRALAGAGRALPRAELADAARCLLAVELLLESAQAGRLASVAPGSGVPVTPGLIAANRALGLYLASFGAHGARDAGTARVLARAALAS